MSERRGPARCRQHPEGSRGHHPRAGGRNIGRHRRRCRARTRASTGIRHRGGEDFAGGIQRQSPDLREGTVVERHGSRCAVDPKDDAGWFRSEVDRAVGRAMERRYVFVARGEDRLRTSRGLHPDHGGRHSGRDQDAASGFGHDRPDVASFRLVENPSLPPGQDALHTPPRCGSEIDGAVGGYRYCVDSDFPGVGKYLGCSFPNPDQRSLRSPAGDHPARAVRGHRPHEGLFGLVKVPERRSQPDLTLRADTHSVALPGKEIFRGLEAPEVPAPREAQPRRRGYEQRCESAAPPGIRTSRVNSLWWNPGGVRAAMHPG